LNIPLSAVAFQSSPEWESAKYLPPDTTIVVLARDVGDRWNELAQSPLVESILNIPQVRRELAGGKWAQIQIGRTMIASVLGAPIEQFAQEWTKNGAVLAWRDKQEVALLFRPSADEAKRLAQTLKELALGTSLSNARNQAQQMFVAKYRELEAYGIGTSRIGFCNGWVVASSTSDFGKSILDRLLGDSAPSLAEEKWFQNAQAFAAGLTGASPSTLTAFANMETVRQRSQISQRRGVDPGAEFLFGGIQDAVDTTDFLVATADLSSNALRVQVGAPCETRRNELREYFYGKDRIVAAPAALKVNHRIASARWHRDIGMFWRMAPQIIQDENALAAIAKSESDISTLMGGMVTVGDVFQFIGPNLEFVAIQPIVSSDSPPSIQLPAFGFSGTLRDVEKAQPALRLAFQQVVSFANLNASSRMYPPLEVMSEKENGMTLISGSYFQMDESQLSDQPGADMYKNFSPTLGFRDDRFVLTSHRDLAKTLLETPVEMGNPAGSDGMIENTVLELWPQEMAKVGEINRAALVAQQMLSSGKSNADAEADVDAVLDVVRQFETVRVRLRASDQSLVLDLDAKLTHSSASK
jgi:hypothetical protein